MLKIKCIDHLVLRTADQMRLVDFYTKVLSCQVELDRSGELGLIQLRAGASMIDIIAVDSKLGELGGPPPKSLGNNMDHFCLEIDTIAEDDLAEYLRLHNVTFGEFADRYGAQGWGRSVYIKDPDGNEVELKLGSA